MFSMMDICSSSESASSARLSFSYPILASMVFDL